MDYTLGSLKGWWGTGGGVIGFDRYDDYLQSDGLRSF